jgi:hypothetical protein
VNKQFVKNISKFSAELYCYLYSNKFSDLGAFLSLLDEIDAFSILEIFTMKKNIRLIARVACFYISFLSLSIIDGLQTAQAQNPPKGETQWNRTLSEVDGHLEQLRLVVPFYEGVEISNPTSSLLEAGMTNFEMAYPGALSAPFVAWTFDGNHWTAAYVETLDALPVSLNIKTTNAGVEISLKCYTKSAYREISVDGDWRKFAKALRSVWDIKSGPRPIAKQFTKLNFYVNRWISQDQAPLHRQEWTVEKLVDRMRRESPDTVQFVYGYDPNGCDLGGKYLWYENAETEFKRVLAANPALTHFSWLNLRTYKTGIPGLDLQEPLSEEIRQSVRIYATGTNSITGSCNAIDMCPASEGWQKSRVEQFDRLVRLGFRFIQIDEFPIPPFWHVNPCLAKNHLHKSSDAADEWRWTLELVKVLAKRAKTHGVALTSEEPSTALLPYVSGYIDRQFNNGIDLYAMWKKSPSIHPIPFFSAMFADICTPYTDVDDTEPARQPPAGWLKQHKVWAR